MLFSSSFQDRKSVIGNHYESVTLVINSSSTGETSSISSSVPLDVPSHRATPDRVVPESAYAQPVGLVESFVPMPPTVESVSYVEIKESRNPQVCLYIYTIGRIDTEPRAEYFPILPDPRKCNNNNT